MNKTRVPLTTRLKIQTMLLAFLLMLAFVCLHLDWLHRESWEQTVQTVGGYFFLLLLALLLLQAVFRQYKKDLALLAARFIQGQSKEPEDQLPELTPIFQHSSQQEKKMSDLNRMNLTGELAASIGHEVRNPLTTVKGFLQYLGGKPEQVDYREFFQLMIEELDRANSIITQFLSLAKDQDLIFQKLNLNQVIYEILPLLQADALRSGSEIEEELGEIPPVIIDVNSIRQLIMNLVKNSIEAMPAGGVVRIATLHSGQAVLLLIQDCGPGIPPEILEAIGRPFMTTKESGTGLGLAVCYRIARSHNAAITVNSQSGKGTTFAVEFRQAE